jgi:predicted deacetylase
MAGAPELPAGRRALRGGRYLLRFDDLCPTLDWRIWDRLEAWMEEAGVKPLLAVVPDNRDAKLVAGPPRPDFWDRVRAWQARGWAIGLHGFRHTYVNAEAGLLGLNRQSEFAGLGYQEQLDKLAQGLAIFQREGVHADAWVAPAHSFDRTTVAALAALGLRTISDGMALAPFLDPAGVAWIPQQFANMRRMPWGLWTFCYHPNRLREQELELFRTRLSLLAPRMVTVEQAKAWAVRTRTRADRLVGLARSTVSGLRRLGR